MVEESRQFALNPTNPLLTMLSQQLFEFHPVDERDVSCCSKNGGGHRIEFSRQPVASVSRCFKGDRATATKGIQYHRWSDRLQENWGD